MKVVRGAFRTLAILVYLVILVWLLTAAPLLLGYHPVVVLTGSMEPQYPVGSVTYYKAADFQNIQPGDVITFRIGSNSTATHRVTAVHDTQQSFITKGDANETEDANPVAYSSVQGKTVNFALPYVGYAISFGQKWYVIAVCGLILLLDMVLAATKKKVEVDPQGQTDEGP